MASKKTTARLRKTWTEDEFGVVSWLPRGSSDVLDHGANDPFARKLEILNNSRDVPEAVKEAAVQVHDGLEVARAIAVSLFGKRWREHVFDVYDRMQARVARVEDGSDTD